MCKQSQIKRLLAILLLAGIALPAWGGNPLAGPSGELLEAQPLQAVVRHVQDGDTILVLAAGKEYWIRFYGIDAPEKAQTWGPESKASLEALIPPSTVVRLRQTGTDRYGRLIAVVYKGAVNLNALQVETGNAWAYDQYLPSESVLHRLESEARKHQRGLWALPAYLRLQPWIWRRLH